MRLGRSEWRSFFAKAQLCNCSIKAGSYITEKAISKGHNVLHAKHLSICNSRAEQVSLTLQYLLFCQRDRHVVSDCDAKSFQMLQSFSLKRRVDGQEITNAVYIVIFSYLILFSIFNSLYLDIPPASEIYQPDHYEVENVTIKPVGCSFLISDYYERTPRYICYLLLMFTVVIRNHKWLAAGAAASVLTYSGVAAIHLIILFATNDRLNLPKAKLHCESLPIPGASAPFLACAGVNDPDVALSMTIVSSVMLGALPVVAWSTTFKRSTSKAILIFWLLLLAVGHTFYALTTTSPSNSFQICPQDHMEPLPRASYQAPLLDQSWRDSFSSVVSSSQSPRNSSSPACIYSCFATAGYIGRKPQDITVWDGVAAQHPFQKTLPPIDAAASHSGGSILSSHS